MTDAETKTREKLSVIRKGHWKNRWVLAVVGWSESLGQSIAPGEPYISAHVYTTSSAAEASGERQLIEFRRRAPSLEFLGPVFFPDP